MQNCTEIRVILHRDPSEFNLTVQDKYNPNRKNMQISNQWLTSLQNGYLIPNPTDETFCSQLNQGRKQAIAYDKEKLCWTRSYMFDVGQVFWQNKQILTIDRYLPDRLIKGTIPFVNNVLNSITQGKFVEMMADLSALHMEFVAKKDRLLDSDPDCRRRWQELEALGIARTFWETKDKLFPDIALRMAKREDATTDMVLKALAILEKRRPYIQQKLDPPLVRLVGRNQFVIEIQMRIFIRLPGTKQAKSRHLLAKLPYNIQVETIVGMHKEIKVSLVRYILSAGAITGTASHLQVDRSYAILGQKCEPHISSTYSSFFQPQRQLAPLDMLVQLNELSQIQEEDIESVRWEQSDQEEREAEQNYEDNFEPDQGFNPRNQNLGTNPWPNPGANVNTTQPEQARPQQTTQQTQTMSAESWQEETSQEINRGHHRYASTLEEEKHAPRAMIKLQAAETGLTQSTRLMTQPEYLQQIPPQTVQDVFMHQDQYQSPPQRSPWKWRHILARSVGTGQDPIDLQPLVGQRHPRPDNTETEDVQEQHYASPAKRQRRNSYD